MVARIESEGVGSSTREKAIMDPLNVIDGVQEVIIENDAIHVTYDPLQTTEKKIEESIHASGNSVTSATTASETPARSPLLDSRLRASQPSASKIWKAEPGRSQ